jgi:hypothetical protein
LSNSSLSQLPHVRAKLFRPRQLENAYSITSEIADRRIEYGVTYSPPDLDPSLASQLLLPSHVGKEESPRDLFMAIQFLLSDMLRQPEGPTIKLTSQALTSWKFDALPMAPALWVSTPPAGPKEATLGLMAALCRRPLRIVGVGQRIFSCLPWHVAPTLLLDEPNVTPTFESVLHSSCRRGTCITAGGSVVSAYGSKMIFSTELPGAAFSAADCFHTALVPVGREYRSLDEQALKQIASEFQPRLLAYRLRNPRPPQRTLDFDSLSAPAQDLAEALAAAVAGDKTLLKMILPVLRAQDEEIQTDRSNSDDGILVETVLAFVHQNVDAVRAKELADRFNAICAGRGKTKTLSPEEVGWALRRLHIPRGCPKGKVDSTGNGLRFDDLNRRLTHKLAIAYSVPSLWTGKNRQCAYCQELRIGGSGGYGGIS